MKIKIYFLFYYIFLIWYAIHLNIGDFEVSYLETDSLINHISNFFFSIFGKNNFSLRFPSIILSFFSILLYEKIAKYYFKSQKEINFTLIIFSLIPGFIIASLLYNKSIYLIFLTLLFIYSFLYYRFFSYILLVLYVFLDYSFISLYFGLIFYSIYKKDTKFLIYSLLLLMINANYFHYDINGHPQGHFLNLFLVYLAIFSPFVFVYFLYAILKTFKKPNLLWFISTFSLLFSIILSFRQKIKIDDYAPFVIISVIFMIKVFLSDYRIRLKIFRKPFKILFVFLFLSLMFFDLCLLASKYFINKEIFYQFNYSQKIVQFLKEKNINYIYCNNQTFCKKLYFYGLSKGMIYYINFDEKSKKVSILHNKTKLYDKSVSKLYKK
jgi:4-amino-4-deoxy-L-arabinose transferase-like glycosyltransferase